MAQLRGWSTTRLTINEDLRVSLLPKKTRGEAVVLRLTLRYGNLKSLSGHANAAEFLPVIMTRGTAQLTRQLLQDALDSNFATLTGSGSAGDVAGGREAGGGHGNRIRAEGGGDAELDHF